MLTPSLPDPDRTEHARSVSSEIAAKLFNPALYNYKPEIRAQVGCHNGQWFCALLAGPHSNVLEKWFGSREEVIERAKAFGGLFDAGWEPDYEVER